jgi:hypothetical protein
MEKDYILTQISQWEDDMLKTYCEAEQEQIDCSISQRIINRLIELSRLTDYCLPNLQCQ